MFLSQYQAVGEFRGNELRMFKVYAVPVGVYYMDQITLVDDPQLHDALFGLTMPLNPADFTSSIGDVPAYAVKAIVIALNDAYQNSLAGQQ